MLGGNRKSEGLEDRHNSSFGDIFLFDIGFDTGDVGDFRVDGEVGVLESCQELRSFGLHI